VHEPELPDGSLSPEASEGGAPSAAPPDDDDAPQAQPARFAPSHVPMQDGASPVHAGRMVCGGPDTAEHKPIAPVTSHASHWPEQAALQQTPSMQKLLVHEPGDVHGWPCAFRASHMPFAAQ